MFNEEFYPTPELLIDKMWSKVSKNLDSDATILEPSAGKGNILDYIKKIEKYNNYEYHCIEPNIELQMILNEKEYKVVWNDFLTFKTFNEYNLIIANPPFSNGDKHLLKMIELAEKQYTDCQIVCLLNAETIRNPFSNSRKELLSKLNKYNAEIEYIKNGFTEAERKTNVETALVYLNIKKSKDNKTVLDELKEYIEENKKESVESKELVLYQQESNLSLRKEDIELYLELHDRHCEIERERYKLNLESFAFEEFEKDVLDEKYLPYDYNTKNTIQKEYEKVIKKINRVYWKKVLYLPEIKKNLTNSKLNELYNKIVELGHFDFNYENIMLLLGSLLQNKTNLIIESVESFFENVTRYSYHKDSGNIHYYNGWKTNDAFKINYKIILPYDSFWIGYKDFDNYNDVNYEIQEFISDIYKMLKLFKDGKFLERVEFIPKGNREFENEFLRFKIFKKGTIHFWFKDKDVIDKINFIVGQKRNWLPSDDEIKTNPKAKEFIEEVFGKKESHLLLENNGL